MNMNATKTQNASEYNQNRSPVADELPRPGEPLNPSDDFIEYVSAYARQKPGTAALWCFGVGFILGWKLKPW
ncbi:hypothetical protein V6x_15460 [Gimesia chilikensis]|uniref:Uncharacterized protein n=1 Tax=Gimesia chilikensis TaxID=2605989 RepID=A0A517W9C9_9PLAN|nr:hypothetical protein [Gimesia chilikensis]QDU01863.1 hypothetical protein V6x_15460 [Gimesia chilikensis]